MEDDSTTLRLLVREGQITVTFVPALDNETYAELLSIVGEHYERSPLKVELERAAAEWGRSVTFAP